MNKEQIPDALKEVWPDLRVLFSLESLKLAEDECNGDHATMGIYVVANQKLLSRLDKFMQPDVKPQVSAKRAPRLQSTRHPSTETP